VKTDELIVQLARSATPVTPLPRPSIRLATWTALAMAVAGLCVFLIGPRADVASAFQRDTFLISLAALLVTSVAGAATAFISSVPGAERSRLQRAVPVIAAIVWPSVWLGVLARSGPSGGRVVHVACVLEITALAIVAGAVLFVMLRRAAPLQVIWTSVVAAMASVTIAAAATQIICPIDDPAHQIVAHVLTAVVVGAAGVRIGKTVFGTMQLSR